MEVLILHRRPNLWVNLDITCLTCSDHVKLEDSTGPRYFSNSLIIHAALTQPEHLILVRWMGLEPPMKNELKTRPCLNTRNNFKHGCKFSQSAY